MQKIPREMVLLAAALTLGLAAIVSAVIISFTGFTIRNVTASTDAQGNSIITNTISVSATGEASVQPDQANITIQISERASTSEEALKMANQKINQLRDIFKTRVDDKNMQTTSLNLRPEYDYRESGRVLIGQVASQSLRIQIDNIKPDASDVAGLIDQASKVNGVTIGSISFGLTDSTSALEAARKDAIEKARQKANQLAGNLGVSVGTPVSVSEGSSDYYNPPVYYDTLAAEDGARAESTQISTGELQTSISVSVVFAIE